MANQGGIKDIAKGRSDLYRLAPDDVHIKDGWNTREADDPENVAHIEAISRSIAEIGQKTPIKVYWEDGKAFVSDGHTRVAAIRLAIANGAEIKTIDCLTESKYANDADRVFTQIVANSGKPLTPFETAKVFKRLVDFGWSPAEIAARSGMTRQRVVDLLELQAAPEAVAQMVRTGQVTATLAQTVMRTDRATASETLAAAVAKAKAEGKTRATAKHVGKSFKTELNEIFSRATVIPGGFMLTDADMIRIRKLVRLPT